MLADVDRVLYDLLGAGRGSIREVWSPGTLALYARLFLQGRRFNPPTEDTTRQLGADAIIGRDGRLVRIWLPPSPDTRLSIDAVVEAVNESER